MEALKDALKEVIKEVLEEEGFLQASGSTKAGKTKTPPAGKAGKAKVIAYEDVQEQFKELHEGKGPEAMKAILTKLKVKKLSEIKEADFAKAHKMAADAMEEAGESEEENLFGD